MKLKQNSIFKENMFSETHLGKANGNPNSKTLKKKKTKGVETQFQEISQKVQQTVKR